MATHIQFHRSCIEGVTPDAGTMLEGEPAVNLADKKLWVKGCTGELITLIGGISAETVAGSSGQIQFNANDGFSANPYFVIDSSSEPPKIGVGTSSPREALEVVGNVLATGVSGDGATFTNLRADGITTGVIYSSADGRDKITFSSAGVVEWKAQNTSFIRTNKPSLGQSTLTINEDSADLDFKVEGNGDANLIYTNAAIDKVGIGTNTPREKLEVVGTILTAGVSGDGATFTNATFVTGITLGVGGITFHDGTTFASTQTDTIGIHVDNASQVLTTGKKGHKVLPYNCEVTEWRLTSRDSGGITWDVNWSDYAGFPTTTSVGGSGLPVIHPAGYTASDTSINWTKKTFNAGDVLEFEIDTVDTLTNCNLSLLIRRNG